MGRIVKFGDGTSRKIIRADTNGSYLNIYLSGEPLDTGKVGLPNKFVVVDKASHDPKESRQ